MKVTATVTVRKNVIKRRISGVRTKTDDATLRTAEFIRDEYRKRAPRDPHHDSSKEGMAIADSIEMKKTETTGEQSLVVQVGSFGAHRNRPVAKWAENGTAKMHARPALRPAANLGRKKLKEEQESAVKEEAAKNE